MEGTTGRRGAVAGRTIALAILALGALLGFLGWRMRGARRPTLPFKPGAIVVLVGGGTPAAPPEPEATRFELAFAPSTEVVANLASLLTGRMPRACGVVRAGDRLPSDVATLAEIVSEQGFATAAFVAADAVDWNGAGLLRGIAEPHVLPESPTAPPPTSRDLATRALEWLAARGTAPSFLLVRFGDGDPDAGVAEFQRRAREQGLVDHAVILHVGERLFAPPTGAEFDTPVALELRLPVALLPARSDRRPVALIDVVPTLLELFGVRGPEDLGPPFLLDPHWRGPRFVLTTRPLAAPFADCDEVVVWSGRVRFVHAPLTGGAGLVDAVFREPTAAPERDPALVADFHRVLTEGFGYRLDEVTTGDGTASAAARVVLPRYVVPAAPAARH